MGKRQDNLYLHADGDSFFVACELSVRPELRGKPVIVGADRGIAVAMSAEARKLGVTRGMPVFKIKKLYPQVIILSHHFDLYEEISQKMYQVLSFYFREVERYSIDECFALVQPFEVKYYGNEQNLMTELKNEIEKTLKVTYSLGLARTKALSKLASKLEKPNGSVMLLSKEEEIKALKATPIDDIWGIGWRRVPRFQVLGLETAFDFSNYSPPKTSRDFSQPVLDLQKELRGVAIFEVKSDVDPRDQKSIQSTATFRPSSNDPKIIRREISENAEHACREARELRLLSNKISFFVKTSEFKYRFAEAQLAEYTADPGVVLGGIETKLAGLSLGKDRIRATGVVLHNLIRQEKPLDLFGRQEKALQNLVVEETADMIRKKFGINSIKRAASLDRSHPIKRTNRSSFQK